jgi:hypothetical protein
MHRVTARLAYALVMTALLNIAFASFADAWSAGTSCSTSTFKICVSYDDGNGLPRATTNLNDSDYNGDVYYNSITPIADTVSSVKNLLSSPTDVLFYDDPGYSGSNRCLPSNSAINDLGWFGTWPDDHFESHLQASAC